MPILTNGKKGLFNTVIRRLHRNLFNLCRVPGMQIVKDISLVKRNKGKELTG